MKTIALIAVAALATLAVGTAMADDRQTDQGDQPTAGAKSGGSESTGGALPSDQNDNQNQSGQSNQSNQSDQSNQSTTTSGPTMKDLLAAGYEVKAISVVPREIVKRGGATNAVDAVAIVLQNGSTLAMCYEEYGTFVTDPTTVACTEYK